MSDDEIKLVTSLAGDKSWQPKWPDDPWDTEAALISLEDQPAYCSIEEITTFLRQFCYWDDLAPKYNELRHWLPILSSDRVKLCELTPQAWARIIETQTVKVLAQ